ncbi:hypothetical protein [Bradyrhizobium diazoefficiens]|uniref:hypothetical protein n=1 Tax=Bradyrhizobium diazoefficiens TaxID=1355477 RepID=UPI00272C8E04|nr:hypothetical protein [Bradyrhizobium diazoefficiens]WLA63753.1 hypothetical protein QNN01_36135 [Bradyrhizobium diazoefficiens]
MFDRRQILAQLGATSFATALGYSHSADAQVGDHDLAGVCVLAFDQRTSRGKSVDVWTARCGSLDFGRLSGELGRFVWWDDVTFWRTAGRSVTAIKYAITRYFHLPIRDDGSNSATHVGAIESIPGAVSHPLARMKREFASCMERIAILDLSSGGVTPLGWHDLVPVLKQAYDVIVGVDQTDPELVAAAPAHYSGPYGTSAESWQTLVTCDYWAVASPASLAAHSDPAPEIRAAIFTELVDFLGRQVAFAPEIAAGFQRGVGENFLGYGAGEPGRSR